MLINSKCNSSANLINSHKINWLLGDNRQIPNNKIIMETINSIKASSLLLLLLLSTKMPIKVAFNNLSNNNRALWCSNKLKTRRTLKVCSWDRLKTPRCKASPCSRIRRHKDYRLRRHLGSTRCLSSKDLKLLTMLRMECQFTTLVSNNKLLTTSNNISNELSRVKGSALYSLYI